MKPTDFMKKASEELRAEGCKPNPTKRFSSPVRLGNDWNSEMSYSSMAEMIADIRTLASAGREIVDADIDAAIAALKVEMK